MLERLGRMPLSDDRTWKAIALGRSVPVPVRLSSARSGRSKEYSGVSYKIGKLRIADDKMPGIHCSAATLRIMGNELVPDEISRLLGCLPTWSHLRGEELIGKRTGRKRIAKFGLWQLRAERREPGDLESQIAEILGQLASDLEVWKKVSDVYRIDMLCGLFMRGCNEGISMPSEMILALGVRGIKLDLDICALGDSEDARLDK